MSVCRSLASSMGRMELSRVEMRAASRLHIAPNTLRSSSRRVTRCSCWTHKVGGGGAASSPELNSVASPYVKVSPSDSTRPETARSHSGWPCTSSCTPLDLHRSEEEITQSSAAAATIKPQRVCPFEIGPGLYGPSKRPLWRFRP